MCCQKKKKKKNTTTTQQILEEMVVSGEVDAGAAEKAKEQYRKLHDALVDTLENDKRLMAKAKQLNVQLGEEKSRAEAAAAAEGSEAVPVVPVGADENTAVDMLREDAEQAEAEATLCWSRAHAAGGVGAAATEG